MTTKYVSKLKKESARVEIKTPTLGNNDTGLLGNLEVRKQVFKFLTDEVGRPASTQSDDLVPLLEEVTGAIPDEFCDDIQDAYCWCVLTLITQGKFTPTKMAFSAWMTQTRPRLVKASMEQKSVRAVKEQDDD